MHVCCQLALQQVYMYSHQQAQTQLAKWQLESQTIAAKWSARKECHRLLLLRTDYETQVFHFTD